MKILELLRNPLIKGIGIVLVLYFALFANTEHPKSLGNRLSSKNIKKDLAEVTDKSKFIVTNVKMAKDLAKNSNPQAAVPSPTTSIEELKIGSGNLALSCGDDAEISYGVYTKSGQQLEFINAEKIIVGSNAKVFLEKNITGMKLGGIRYVNVSNGSQIADEKIMQLLKLSNSDLKIQITLLSFAKSATPNISCH